MPDQARGKSCCTASAPSPLVGRLPSFGRLRLTGAGLSFGVSVGVVGTDVGGVGCGCGTGTGGLGEGCFMGCGLARLCECAFGSGALRRMVRAGSFCGFGTSCFGTGLGSPAGVPPVLFGFSDFGVAGEITASTRNEARAAA